MKGEFSTFFTLQKLTRSDAAIRKGVSNIPADELLNNGIRLSNYLDLVQAHVDIKFPGKKLKISSGYRSPYINSLIGGSKTSDHCKFCAADIELDGVTPYDLACMIRDNLVGFKQLIFEFAEWVHVAIPQEGVEPALQKLTAVMKIVNGKRQAVYSNGINKI